MSIRDDILGHLAKGPAKSSELAEALSLSPMQVSQNCSALKTEGRLERNDETHQWSLASNGTHGGAVELLEATRARRVPAKRQPKAEPTTHEKIQDALGNQVQWAEQALEEHLTALGDPKTKVLVDNLLAAKAAQLAYEAEA